MDLRVLGRGAFSRPSMMRAISYSDASDRKPRAASESLSHLPRAPSRPLKNRIDEFCAGSSELI
jgi:hypothetical protein